MDARNRHPRKRADGEGKIHNEEGCRSSARLSNKPAFCVKKSIFYRVGKMRQQQKLSQVRRSAAGKRDQQTFRH